MEWIKVSERLPKTGEEVICTCVKKDGSRYVKTEVTYYTTDFSYISSNGFYEYDHYYEEETPLRNPVIAWMPYDALTPYQG